MPTLTPTPTITIPSAPVKATAQTPRTGRTDHAAEQIPSPFTEALKAASGEAEQAEPTPVETARPEQADAGAVSAETGEQDAVTPEHTEAESDDSERPTAEPESVDEIPLNPDLEAQVVSEIESGEAVIAPAAQEQAKVASSAPQAKAEASNPTTLSTAVSVPESEQPVLTSPEVSTRAATATSTQATPVVPETTSEQTQPDAKPAPVTTIATQQPTQPTNNTTAPTTAEPMDAQAIAVQNRDDAAADDQQRGNQQQSGQRHAASLTNITPAEAPQTQAPIDAPAAQPLREAVADAAPQPVDPAAIEAPASQPSLGSIGAKQSAATSQAAAPSLGQVETEQAFTASVQRGLAAAVRQQGGTLTIKLDPPTLGKLTIKMTIDQGRVGATFDAQTAQARDLLMEHTTTLRAALRDKGLSVERLEVLGATSAGAGKASQSAGNTAEQQGAGQDADDQQHDAAGGQSRGRSETGEDEPSGTDGVQGDTAGTAGEPVTSPFEAQLRYSVSAVA